MSKKSNTKTSKVLMYLLAAKKDFEAVFPSPRQFVKDSLFSSYGEFKNLVYHLRRQKWVEVVKKNNERFIKLTRNGEIEALLAKARLPSAKGGRWDGKWRIIIFDIPEESGAKRDLLRRLLKENGFLSLQASVFISPWPLNREAIAYLRESGLIGYVRIIKAEEIDDDADLRKRFQLPAFT
jgi:DNA-binding transcriptional regulator PaaX